MTFADVGGMGSTDLAPAIAERGISMRELLWDTPLLQAAAAGNAKRVAALLAQELVSPDLRVGKWGIPLLAAACARMSESDVDTGARSAVYGVLLAAGALLDTEGPYRDSPLTAAASYGDVVLLELLFGAGVEVRPYRPHGVVYSDDDYTLSAQLDEAGPTRRSAPREAGPALYVAARNGHFDAVRLLIEHGAEADEARPSSAVTPLHAAAGTMRTDIAALLLERGASVDPASSGGATPLRDAAWRGGFETMRLLLRHGAAPTPSMLSGAPRSIGRAATMTASTSSVSCSTTGRTRGASTRGARPRSIWQPATAASR